VISLLAIDPGQKHCGFALLKLGTCIELVEAGECRLDTLEGQGALQRVFALGAARGDCVGVVYESAPFGGAHGRDEQLGQRIRRGQALGQGIMRGLAMAHGLAVLQPVNVRTAKAAVGHGDAGKAGVIRGVALRLGVTLTEHAADACAVGIAALRRWAGEQRRARRG
jgi:Holliday junction resolvasome RuvABC endonuclease subunit